jgi:hypothetical protein
VSLKMTDLMVKAKCCIRMETDMRDTSPVDRNTALERNSLPGAGFTSGITRMTKHMGKES